ncbi:MAG: pilus assembly protein TadG-related protein [Candidatus Korobacteraceae bacterium]
MTDLLPTQKQNLKRFGRTDEGQALVLTALALVVLMLMAGMGVDIGYLRYQKQQMQKAADAGAIAGAAALIYSGSASQITNAAWNDTSANGFTNGQSGVTVTVNNPPQTVGDPYYNQAGYVEVIVAQAWPTFFMRVAGLDSVMVRGRAVASALGSAPGCIFITEPSGTFTDSGSAKVLSQCTILINSSSTPAFNISGSAIIQARSIGIVGGWMESGSAQVSPPPVTGIAPFSDPLAGLPEPAIGTCTTQQQIWSGSQTGTLSGGTFCGGINISGSAHVTFSPGTYILDGGGLNISGAATGVGTEVTFYNTADPSHSYGPINLSGSSSTSFSAPTSGSLAGILFFQDRSIPTTAPGSIISGSGGQVYTGALYFPTTSVNYSGSSTLGTSPYTLIVAYSLTLSGSTTYINDDYSSLPGGVSPIHAAVLAE